MADEVVDPEEKPWLHLVSAFLAMEPTESLLSLARECGGGSVSVRAQRFIWDHCISKSVCTIGKGNAPYLKNFLKKLIVEVESNNGDVLDELYEQYAYYMTLLKDDNLVRGDSRVYKCISFLFPKDCFEVVSCPRSMKLVVPLQCSLNMFEGDTGCSVWPSSLFMSEFILSHPNLFSNKSCFEVGSGTGLVGICLTHVKASKVILSDGDLSTLANMKFNMELNQLSSNLDVHKKTVQHPKLVRCINLQWESALESELQEFKPDIILGADVIYDPLCLPNLVRVIAILLNRTRSCSDQQKHSCLGFSQECKSITGGKVDRADNIIHLHNRRIPDANSSSHAMKASPVAYIASVIRNMDTFNYFLALADQAKLSVRDVTEKFGLFNLLPHMQSYNRSSIRLFTVSY